MDSPADSLPWVTVVCLCYNQAPYVVTALDSIAQQGYPKVELIVVDNASSDGSPEVIRQWLAEHPEIPATFLPQAQNLGICAGFNVGWRAGSGQYCIDLAADDILLPERVQVGVREMEQAGEEFGVHFSDCQEITAEGQPLANFYWGKDLPQGEVFIPLVESYCIPIPSLMFRRAMLEQLGGYNEQLHYEDFDILVRAARRWKFQGSPEVLVYKRMVPRSKGEDRLLADNPHLLTTAQVCEWIWEHCTCDAEYQALRRRVDYELREALRIGHRTAASRLLQLSERLPKSNWKSRLWKWWARWQGITSTSQPHEVPTA
ncbi:MAG TPA: chondroitin polymerase [Cytophagales bacterium]|nr:chondroitin polymerase [Cytophagales bacterium]HAA22918.1 chondroitin polymerase [Cytophagales bacterium]HAP62573.1 chondroitin polymerase [Cytophagales bacterium]